MLTYTTTNAVLQRIKEIFPEAAFNGVLKHLVNPDAFQNTYRASKTDLDKYFSYISVATTEELKNLTVHMPSVDMTEQVELILAKILLGLQRLSYSPSGQDIDPHDSDLLRKLYFG